MKRHPLMVGKAEAAALLGISAATYTKAERKGLVPPMNALGKVSVYALKRAALHLDGIRDVVTPESPDDALARWEAENDG